jgi:ATP-dependent DNA helicase DinG
VCADFPSPFPYRTNVLLAVPDDAPYPSDQAFQSYTEEAVCKLIEAASGRTLVLFTSYVALQQTKDAAQAYLRNSGYTLLKQGDDDRARLLDTFKKDTSSVLFATDSFWEGIDVPGASLSQVIIVKLPFSVPSDPVFAARCEALEQKGRSSFMELSVPDAVIKFRQGFGRLLRHSNDRGAVVVLDRRITGKPYGRLFLSSLPETKTLFSPIKTIAARVADFLS